MLIKKSERIKEQLAKTGTVWDYPLPSKTMGVAVQELKGRVPASGWWRNVVCHEVCFVLAGKGTVGIEGQKFSVAQGDVFIIAPGKKSYVKSPRIKLLTITTPDWYSDQCEVVA